MIILFLCFSLLGDTGLRSEHFAVLSEAKDDARSRRVLERLEELRSALVQLHGPAWVPKQGVSVWIPGSIEAYRLLATRQDQAGLYQSGAREGWIVVSPKAEFLLEVVSHEYMHAVLANVLPGLPWWLEEGLCEYYSSLQYTGKGILVGKPPGRRLEEWRRQSEGAESYASAWARVATLSREVGFPGRLPRPEKVEIPAPRLFAGKRPILEATRSAEISLLWSEGTDAAEEGFLAASRLLDEGKAEAAIPLLVECTRQRPANSTWWHTLAFAYGEAGQVENKKAAAERALAAAVNEMERQQALSLLR